MTENTAFISVARDVYAAIFRFNSALTSGLSDSTKRRRARELAICVDALYPIVMNTQKTKRSAFLETLEELDKQILKVPKIEMIIRGGCVCTMQANALKAARRLDSLYIFVMRKTPPLPYRTDKEAGDRLREEVCGDAEEER